VTSCSLINRSLLRLLRRSRGLAALAIAVALLFAVNPEIRLLLLWLNFIGVDLLLLILVFEVRHYLAMARPSFIVPAFLRFLSLVFPRISPSLHLIRVGPRVALCALIFPLITSAFLVWSVGKTVAGRLGIL